MAAAEATGLEKVETIIFSHEGVGVVLPGYYTDPGCLRERTPPPLQFHAE